MIRELTSYNMEQVPPALLERFFSNGKTFSKVQEELKKLFPGQRGFSIISIKRFCRKHGISPRLSRESLQTAVSEAVDEVRKYIYENLLFLKWSSSL